MPIPTRSCALVSSICSSCRGLLLSRTCWLEETRAEVHAAATRREEDPLHPESNHGCDNASESSSSSRAPFSYARPSSSSVGPFLFMYATFLLVRRTLLLYTWDRFVFTHQTIMFVCGA